LLHVLGTRNYGFARCRVDNGVHASQGTFYNKSGFVLSSELNIYQEDIYFLLQLLMQ
jgi:hypothetical protein